ncbi:alkaline phosphatase D family protein [Myxococcaceae bacterium GXIMD 01537]
MKRLLGPVLYAESQAKPDVWTFRLNLYLHGGDGAPPPLRITFFEQSGGGSREALDVRISGPLVAANFSALADARYAGIYWSWHVEVPRAATARVLMYRVASTDAAKPFDSFEVPEVVVPAAGQLPRMAFFSCNGTPKASDLNGREPLALWDAMLDEHQRMVAGPSPEGFSLLLGGGDQLYADVLFDDREGLPLLWRFAHRLSNKERMKLSLKDSWEEERARLLAGYVRLYCQHWGEGSGISEMLARAPGVFVWDDHDIVDGWGSHEQLQTCDVYRVLYPEAARAYEAFQLGREGFTGASLPNPISGPKSPPHYFQALSFPGQDCDLELVGLDARSGRGTGQVLSPEQWARLDTWRSEDVARSQAAPGRKRQVLVISAVPLVYRRFSQQLEVLASTLAFLKDAGLRDDMLDAWDGHQHRAERARLIKTLLRHVKDARCALTVLSGDVHVGAHGRILSSQPEHLPAGRTVTVIEQPVSSAIVHPEVRGAELGLMNLISDISPDPSLGAGIEARLERVDTGGVVIAERNWLDLEPERAPRSELRMQWYTERSKRLPTRVVVTPP